MKHLLLITTYTTLLSSLPWLTYTTIFKPWQAAILAAAIGIALGLELLVTRAKIRLADQAIEHHKKMHEALGELDEALKKALGEDTTTKPKSNLRVVKNETDSDT